MSSSVNRLRFGLVCFCVAVLVFSGARIAPTPNGTHTEERATEAVGLCRYADEVGRFLAGLPTPPGSPFSRLEGTTAWRSHRQQLDSAWKRTESDRLTAMRSFRDAELGEGLPATAPVFYPFSGPDALTATVFFPRSPTYILVGLEPAGTLPEPRAFENKNLESYLQATRSALASELGRSFFVTRQMDRQFRGQVTDGLCLPILELLERSGHSIRGFRYIRLDDEGHIVERAPNYHAPGRIGNKGFEVEFATDADASIHQLFYFSVNLSNARLKEDQPFLAYLASLPRFTTFLKATSYMVHRADFSIIRAQVLSQSLAVLQDDSGVPYHFYAAPDWRVQLYGEYVRPYGSFRYLVQPDLRNAYLTQKPKPLPFRIGYGFGRIESNLQFAERVN